MYSRYDPTVHDTFLPVSREAKTIDFPVPAHDDDAAPTTVEQPALPQENAAVSAQASTASAPARGGLLDGLKGLFGGLGRGTAGSLDLGDIILLLIVALLFLEGGGDSDLIILLAVALFIGF